MWRTAIVAPLAFALAACGGGGGGSSSGGGTTPPPAIVTDYAPDLLPAGMSMSINPMLVLADSVTLNYNNSAADSAFTDSVKNATWAYTPYTAGDRTGTFTVSGDGGPATTKHFSGSVGRTAVLLNWVFSNHQIIGATATINGSTYNVTLGGTLPSPGKGPAAHEQTTPNVIPAKYEGTYALTYKSFAPSGSYKDGDKVSFTVANDTLSFDGKSLTGPVANVNGDPYDFADGGTGIVYRYGAPSSYGVDGGGTVTNAPTVTILQGGAIVGQFMQTASITVPPGTVYGPLADKVHNMVCVAADDPNTSDRIGLQAVLKFKSFPDAKLAFSLEYAGGGYGTINVPVLNGGDSGISPYINDQPSFYDPSVFVHYEGTFTVDANKKQCTEVKFYTEYSRNGAVFRRSTVRYALTYTNTP